MKTWFTYKYFAWIDFTVTHGTFAFFLIMVH